MIFINTCYPNISAILEQFFRKNLAKIPIINSRIPMKNIWQYPSKIFPNSYPNS